MGEREKDLEALEEIKKQYGNESEEARRAAENFVDMYPEDGSGATGDFEEPKQEKGFFDEFSEGFLATKPKAWADTMYVANPFGVLEAYDPERHAKALENVGWARIPMQAIALLGEGAAAGGIGNLVGKKLGADLLGKVGKKYGSKALQRWFASPAAKMAAIKAAPKTSRLATSGVLGGAKSHAMRNVAAPIAAEAGFDALVGAANAKIRGGDSDDVMFSGTVTGIASAAANLVSRGLGRYIKNSFLDDLGTNERELAELAELHKKVGKNIAKYENVDVDNFGNVDKVGQYDPMTVQHQIEESTKKKAHSALSRYARTVLGKDLDQIDINQNPDLANRAVKDVVDPATGESVPAMEFMRGFKKLFLQETGNVNTGKVAVLEEAEKEAVSIAGDIAKFTEIRDHIINNGEVGPYGRDVKNLITSLGGEAPKDLDGIEKAVVKHLNDLESASTKSKKTLSDAMKAAYKPLKSGKAMANDVIAQVDEVLSDGKLTLSELNLVIASISEHLDSGKLTGRAQLAGKMRRMLKGIYYKNVLNSEDAAAYYARYAEAKDYIDQLNNSDNPYNLMKSWFDPDNPNKKAIRTLRSISDPNVVKKDAKALEGVRRQLELDLPEGKDPHGSDVVKGFKAETDRPIRYHEEEGWQGDILDEFEYYYRTKELGKKLREKTAEGSFKNRAAISGTLGVASLIGGGMVGSGHAASTGLTLMAAALGLSGKNKAAREIMTSPSVFKLFENPEVRGVIEAVNNGEISESVGVKALRRLVYQMGVMSRRLETETVKKFASEPDASGNPEKLLKY